MSIVSLYIKHGLKGLMIYESTYTYKVTPRARADKDMCDQARENICES